MLMIIATITLIQMIIIRLRDRHGLHRRRRRVRLLHDPPLGGFDRLLLRGVARVARPVMIIIIMIIIQISIIVITINN